jgi:beta-glucosidase
MAGEDKTADTSENRNQLRAEAVAAARSSDIALLFIGDSDKYERESADRASMDLPAGQDELVEAVLAANPKTVIVFNAGASIDLTRWSDRVPAIVDAWYGGEEGGHAIADVLFGDVNPSGKLPFTFLRKAQDSPASSSYPGVDLHTKYAEGIYVGYRYFDKHPRIAPLFPFGYGLSYTKFAYSGLHAPTQVSGNGDIDVQVTVKNTGKRAGAEVAQLYVGDPHASVDRPEKELKAFQRVDLAPGESRTIHFKLDRRALSFWSVGTHAWVAEPGRFDVLVGSSSRDIRLRGSFNLIQ